MERMPVVFSGHGDPMIALRDDEVTRGMREIGFKVLDRFGKPKAILAISAHWYTAGNFIQRAAQPKQIYDMYGFPQELYEVKYPVSGCAGLTERVQALLGDEVSVNDEWGIDHGSWTVLVHMFPNADIPVVQLSVNRQTSNAGIFELGKKLAPLRDEDYLILGSGNVVHNLRRVEWGNPNGSEQTLKFNQYVVDRVNAGDTQMVIEFANAPEADYAVPTPEHYLPLIYCLGAADGDKADIFNNVCNLGAIAMTGFAFGMK